jgi:hypothetical protein
LNHDYNHASENMRSVEVPIGLHFMSEFDPARVLEVGNVLSHYGAVGWRSLDLRDGDIREDLMTYQPKRKLAAILSISTLEHVGFGRYVGTGDPDPQAVIRHLRGWLARGGAMLVTIPIGYNPAWDDAITRDVMGADQFFMLRLNDDNEWKQVGEAQAFAVYPRRWRWGAALAILRWRQ